MKSSHILAAGIVLVLAAAGSASAVQSVTIHVTPPPDVAAETELPMYVGLPLPATPTIQSARLLDETGREIPSQTELLATWTKEGAARWVGLRFVGRAGGKYR